MIIVVDTREQLPYYFGRWEGMTVVRDTLEVGDYSLLHYRDYVAVERKSLHDFYGSIGKGHKRFFRELRQMACMKWPLLVVESRMTKVMDPEGNRFTGLKNPQVWGSVETIVQDLRIPILFAETRSIGEEATFLFLLRAHNNFQKYVNIPMPYKTPHLCNICWKTRIEALEERPDLGIREWCRTAVRVQEGRVVLNDRLDLCYDCRARINRREADLPEGYQWEDRVGK
jgi:hypothetical protein